MTLLARARGFRERFPCPLNQHGLASIAAKTMFRWLFSIFSALLWLRSERSSTSCFLQAGSNLLELVAYFRQPVDKSNLHGQSCVLEQRA